MSFDNCVELEVCHKWKDKYKHKKRQNQTEACIIQATHPLTAHVEVRVCHSASPLSSMERMGRVQDSESDDAQDDESDDDQDAESDDAPDDESDDAQDAESDDSDRK